MKIIQHITEMIDEELCDAKKYAECALKYKDDYPELAKALYTLSEEEMGHQKRLHDQVTTIIRSLNGNVPTEMQAVYNYLHQKQIERAEDVRIVQSMYNR